MLATFMMTLNDAKVSKRFGRHPERGVRLPFIPPVRKTAGIRWVQFAKKYKPNPIEVTPTVILRRVKTGWQITCPQEYRGLVTEWLNDNLS